MSKVQDIFTCIDCLANVLRMGVKPDRFVDDVVGPPHLGGGARGADGRGAVPHPQVVTAFRPLLQMLPVEVEPIGPIPAGLGDKDKEVMGRLHGVESLSDLVRGSTAAEN